MQKYIIAIVALVVGFGLGHYFLKSSSSLLGSTLNCQSSTCLTGGLEIVDTGLQVDAGGITNGSSGSLISQSNFGTMTCATGASSITALASSTYQCAVSAATTASTVFVSLPKGTPDSIYQVGAHASTTANGFIELVLGNVATTTKNVAGATSSVQYFLLK